MGVSTIRPCSRRSTNLGSGAAAVLGRRPLRASASSFPGWSFFPRPRRSGRVASVCGTGRPRGPPGLSRLAEPLPHVIEMRGVTKRFGAHEVLRSIDLSVQPGEKVVVIGASGSGKSTLLRCINGLERVQEGSIVVEGIRLNAPGTDIRRVREEVGFVFQQFNLFPHMTALRNVSLALERVRGKRRDEAEAAALDQLARVGLADKAGAWPAQLSGGQQQRVAIARTLALRPHIMLFDEPTSALDPELVNEVLDVIRDVAKGGMTILLVTHEMRFARQIADRVVYMDEGRIVEEGPPGRLFDHPRHPRTVTFLSKVL
jgi:ABC-type polar amino acid transport system ATPase subunit